MTTLKTPKCYKHIVKKDYFYQYHLHHRYILTIELKVPPPYKKLPLNRLKMYNNTTMSYSADQLLYAGHMYSIALAS